MYIFLSSLLALGILFLFLGYLSFGKKNSKLPPGTFGWPIIGESLEYNSALLKGCPEKFFRDRMNKFSPTQAVKTSILGEKMVFLDGPSGNKLMYANEDKLVVGWWPFSIQSIFFPGPQPEKMMKRVRVNFLEVLRQEALFTYVPLIQEVVEDHLEKNWIGKKEVKVNHLSQKLVFFLVSRIVIGLDDAPEIDMLHDLLVEVATGVLSIPINFPGTPFYRATKASFKIRKQLIPIIKKKRSQLLSGEINLEMCKDVFSQWVLQKQADGNFLSDMEIADDIFAFIVASHATTSSLVTAIIYYLASYPHVYAKVLEEQRNISNSKAPGTGLAWEDLQHMNYCRNVVNEALRMAGPLGHFREAITDLTFGGFVIPKGWKIFLSAHSIHKNEKFFPNPNTFDPSRFEGNGPPPFTFIPFGGGPRMCPGNEFARVETLVIMHCLVTKFNWEKVFPEEELIFYPEATYDGFVSFIFNKSHIICFMSCNLCWFPLLISMFV